MRAASWTCILILASAVMPGCMIVQVGVTNPVPQLSRVAIVPFFNLSQEKTVDGRRFSLAYYTELQKVEGFQVLPVGVAEQAIFDNNLEMSNPSDALELARILAVDIVVVGAVTDYDPYYPPRVGLQVSWYSPHSADCFPSVDSMVSGKSQDGYGRYLRVVPQTCGSMAKRLRAARSTLIRGQSPEPPWSDETDTDKINPDSSADTTGIEATLAEPGIELPTWGEPAQNNSDAVSQETAFWEDSAAPTLPVEQPPAAAQQPATEPNSPRVSDGNDLTALAYLDPHQPLMSYTRLFDGSDADLVARLRDYVELSGDRRSGGWEAYLHRSEDFIRFASHVMIVEMLSLHGGETRHRFVFKLRKHM